MISDHERRYTAAHLARSGFVGSSELFLIDPLQGDRTDLVDQAEELATRERKLKESAASVSLLANEVTIPPRLGVLSFAPVERTRSLGDTATVALELTNVGDETAKSVVVSVTASPLDDAVSRDLGTLAGGDRTTVQFEIPASEAGDLDAQVSVDSENAGSVTETARITVRTKEHIVRRVRETLGDIGDTVDQKVEHPETARSITSKLEAAIGSLDRALAAIGGGRNDQTNSAINTSTNQLGSLLNSIDRGNKDGRKDKEKRKKKNKTNRGRKEKMKNGSTKGTIPPALERSVVKGVELSIDQLADARRIHIHD